MGYDETLKEINEIKNTISRLRSQVPIHHVRDKCGLNFKFENINNSDSLLQRAMISFQARHGQYGSSSVYNDMDERLAESITRALKKLELDIIDKAISILEKDIEGVAEKAKSEAAKIIELSNKTLEAHEK